MGQELIVRTLGTVGLFAAGSGQPQPVQPKRLLVLVYLLLEGPQSRADLAALFYGGNRSAFNTNLHHLRAAGLVTSGASHVEAAPRLTLDVHELECASAAGDAEAFQVLYRGPFLQSLSLQEWKSGGGVELEAWVLETRERLERDARSFQLSLAETLQAKGLSAHARRLAERALRLDDLDLPAGDELRRFHALLVASGSALAAELAEELAEELGEELGGESAGAATARPGATRIAGLLRAADPGFVGRARELEALARDLAAGRKVVRLLGRSGVGKSATLTELVWRLAASGRYYAICTLELSKDPHYRYGLADLARLLFSALPSEEEAAALKAWEEARLPHHRLLLLQRTFAARPTLLALDSAGHALHGGRLPEELELFARFLLEHPCGLQLLSANRFPVPLPADLAARCHREIVMHPLDGLEPAAAAELLRSLDPEGKLGLSAQPQEVLEALAGLLQGNPRQLKSLAGLLQLHPTLSVAELLAEPGRVEAIGAREAQLEFAELSPRERQVLEALAIFEAPVPLAVLGALLPEVPVQQVVDPLVLRELVLHRPGAAGPLLALTPHDRQALAEALPAHRRQAFHLAAADAYRRLAAKPRHPEELANAREAFAHLLAAERPEAAARLLLAFGRRDLLRLGLADLAQDLAQRVLPRLEPGSHLHHKVLGLLCRACQHQGDPQQTLARYREALDGLARAGDRRGLALCRSNLGLYLGGVGRVQEAIFQQQTTLGLERKLGNARGEAQSLGYLGLHHFQATEDAAAARYLDQAIAASRALGCPGDEAVWWGVLALVRQRQGRGEDALAAAREALRLHYQHPGAKEAEASALDNLGQLLAARGEAEAALALWLAAYCLHHRVQLRAAVRRHLMALRAGWDAFDAALERLSADREAGDALLRRATLQPYRLFGSLPLADLDREALFTDSEPFGT